MSKVLTYEELERKNFLLTFKSKDEIVDMLLWYEKEKDDFIKAIIELQYEIVDLKSVLKEIREYIEKSLINVGRNEDCFEYYLETTDIEKLLEIIDK